MLYIFGKVAGKIFHILFLVLIMNFSCSPRTKIEVILIIKVHKETAYALYAVSFINNGLPLIIGFIETATSCLKNEGTWAYM